MLIASRLIVSKIALSQFNSPVVVTVLHAIVGHVPDPATAAASVGGVANCSRSDFDTRAILTSQLLSSSQEWWRITYRSVVQGSIVDQNILHDINLADILAERTDGDTMGTIAVEILARDESVLVW